MLMQEADEVGAAPGAHSGRVLLAGASGYIGAHVGRTLRAEGYEVLALHRGAVDPLRGAPGVTVCRADAFEARSLQVALAGERIDAVISCIASRNGAKKDAWAVDHDANAHLLAAAKAAGAKHFVLLSAICVQKPRLAFQHAKLAFEATLRESGLRYSIVRPTAYFKSLAGQIARVQAGKPFLVFGEGTETSCKPIGEEDLARYLVACLSVPERGNRVLPIGGPGPAITPREQGTLLCELAGQPVNVRSVSPRLFDAAIAVLSPLSRVIPPLAAKAEFARIGRYYATESMLHWDPERQVYDAEQTPSTGSQTLRAFYARVLGDGLQDQALGEHKLF
ncbi:MAG: NAD(P)H-binding protein [Pseudomonadota bacterium]